MGKSLFFLWFYLHFHFINDVLFLCLKPFSLKHCEILVGLKIWINDDKQYLISDNVKYYSIYTPSI